MENTPQVNEICRISKGTRFTGVFNSSSDIRIDGCFEGDIFTSGKLVIGESAEVKGRIACQSSDVWGKIDGQVYISDSITFKSSAKFSGSLKTSKISIEMGAVFCGSCNIITTDEFNKVVSDMKIGAETPAAPVKK